ncbi:hypothetical protein [Cytobacillus gottheilii]|uniref:hypothetical protein n=1 Tax=Cytobacillus gottheilii TaxID=859144 RepID=UPI002495388C|nr:hypothetical protein [Cytobacillus gottheilii]
MNVTNKVAIGLTQFIDFTVKGSEAKTNMVRKIKYQEDYHPSFDYWKKLREGITKFHQENLSFDYFDSLIDGLDEKKKPNYIEYIKQYKKFLRNKDIVWFDPGKAIWVGDELNVRASSELGLIIDGEPNLIKLYFKGKNERIDNRNIRTTLTLLNSATKQQSYNFETNNSVLNISKNKFYTDNNVNADKLIALESEASQFMYIWNKI